MEGFWLSPQEAGQKTEAPLAMQSAPHDLGEMVSCGRRRAGIQSEKLRRRSELPQSIPRRGAHGRVRDLDYTHASLLSIGLGCLAVIELGVMVRARDA